LESIGKAGLNPFRRQIHFEDPVLQRNDRMLRRKKIVFSGGFVAGLQNIAVPGQTSTEDEQEPMSITLTRFVFGFCALSCFVLNIHEEVRFFEDLHEVDVPTPLRLIDEAKIRFSGMVCVYDIGICVTIFLLSREYQNTLQSREFDEKSLRNWAAKMRKASIAFVAPLLWFLFCFAFAAMYFWFNLVKNVTKPLQKRSSHGLLWFLISLATLPSLLLLLSGFEVSRENPPCVSDTRRWCADGVETIIEPSLLFFFFVPSIYTLIWMEGFVGEKYRESKTFEAPR